MLIAGIATLITSVLIVLCMVVDNRSRIGKVEQRLDEMEPDVTQTKQENQ